MKIENIKRGLTGSLGNPQPLKFIPTGSTLLNLALSQKPDGGWARGRIINLVGDGGSGKTLLALEACASAFYRIEVSKKKYIVYNNVEGVMDFDIVKMYGQAFADSIIWQSTDTCEDFGRDYMTWLTRLKQGEFLLYVVDSLDATISEKQKERTLTSIKTQKSEKESYGVEKAKYFSSSLFNSLCGMMQGKDATLICISQIREKIGIMFGEKYYRAGGKALDFYTHQVAWLAQVEKIKKIYQSHDRIVGAKIRVNIKRNKVSKPFRQCDVLISYDYGIDDLNSNLEFLYGSKKIIVWEKTKYKRMKFIKYLETNCEMLNQLLRKAIDLWVTIEDKVMLKRKNRFTLDESKPK